MSIPEQQLSEEEQSDSDSDAPPEAASSRAPAPKEGRSNKNRPAQLSSKKRVSTFRIAPGLKASSKVVVRDPRFDPHSKSEFDEVKWRQSYDFLFEEQRAEAERMKAALDTSRKASKRAAQHGGGAKRQRVRDKVLTPEQTAEMKLELERTENRLAQDERRQKREQAKAELRKQEVTKRLWSPVMHHSRTCMPTRSTSCQNRLCRWRPSRMANGLSSPSAQRSESRSLSCSSRLSRRRGSSRLSWPSDGERCLLSSIVLSLPALTSDLQRLTRLAKAIEYTVI